jgi:molybdopterin/thiamine biosynthesis adenylyltransferase
MTSEQSIFHFKVESALLAYGALNLSVPSDKNGSKWSFEIFKHDQTWPLSVQTVGWSLTPLPYVHWEQPAPIWGWPHVGSDGSICILEREGLDYDPDDINGIVSELLNRSVALLSKYQAVPVEARVQEFADELEAYAIQMNISSLTLDSPIDADMTAYAEIDEKNKLKRNELPVIKKIHKGRVATNGNSIRRLQVVDMDIAQLPALCQSLNVAWWQQLLLSANSNQKKLLNDANAHGMILRIANQFGGAHLLFFWGRKQRAGNSKIYVLVPSYHEYLMRRVGLASLPKHMAVVGVGAVGSRVAEHLALAGVKTLTLVDHDKMTSHNLGRHVLSRDWIGVKKATALAHCLEQRMPGITINQVAEYAHNWLSVSVVAQLDVIVLATGDPAMERAMMRRAWRENWPCKIVSTFVEAGGLGGHAISMIPNQHGCLECLYIQDDQGQQILRVGLLKPRQDVVRALNGCGAFTPYSAIDATRTALLAVELALDATLDGYYRWAGAGEQAKQQGLVPSDVWEAVRAQRIPLFVPKAEYIQTGCPCCGN